MRSRWRWLLLGRGIGGRAYPGRRRNSRSSLGLALGNCLELLPGHGSKTTTPDTLVPDSDLKAAHKDAKGQRAKEEAGVRSSFAGFASWRLCAQIGGRVDQRSAKSLRFSTLDSTFAQNGCCRSARVRASSSSTLRSGLTSRSAGEHASAFELDDERLVEVDELRPEPDRGRAGLLE